MSFRDNFVYGLKSYFRHLADGKLVMPGQMPDELVQTIHIKTIEKEIENTTKPCVLVSEMYNDSPATARLYTKTTRSGRIPSSGENRCRIWLKGYYEFLKGEVYIAPVVVLPDIPKLPDLPDFSLPDMPDTSGWKRSLQVTALVVIAVVLVIVYMMTGKGKKGVTVVT